METVQEWEDKMVAKGYLSKFDPGAFHELAEYTVEARSRRDRRGLFLIGNCGTGKTMFLELFLKCRMWTARQIVDLFQQHGHGQNFKDVVHGSYTDGQLAAPPRPLSIDDVGAEPTARRYGETLEVLDDVLTDRYVYWQKHDVKTFITSNLSMDGFHKRYGTRVTDRLTEMCRIIEFTGESARHA